ncbi:hypothetical protein MPER_10442 [Moniliophthora perniciosa FA553]|nr:hypothetical protein MPER_10442 [Moniliophthora perniciosa FA553]
MLVQVCNTSIEKSLDKKMKPRYQGPYVIVRQMKGGSYIVAEMDGTVLKEKVATFRVVPHKLHYRPVILPEDLLCVLDVGTEELDSIEIEAIEDESVRRSDYDSPDYGFYSMGNEKDDKEELTSELVDG